MANSDIQNGELPLDSAGARLRRAREAAGLSLGDVAARTKIAERHLGSIEESRFGALASRTYAVGFARAYARTVGLDEGEIAQAVRGELAASDASQVVPKGDAFEPGDPARVPGSRLAWAAGLGAAVVILFVFVFWRSFFSPAASLPELTAKAEPTVSASASASPVAPAAPAGGAVVFTATAPDIWVKFYDAAGNQLLQKQLAQGESYTVPADAEGPMIRTARPDALAITVGGRPVPGLGDKPTSVRDVPVTAAALLARPAPVPVANAVPGAAPAPAPVVPAARPSASAVPERHAATPSPVPRATAVPAPAPASTSVPAPAPPPAAPAEPSTVSD